MDFNKISDVALINTRLEELYNKHIVKNQANFRLVWANDQIEKRRGTFNVYYGDIFLRQESGIKEVPKYPWFQDEWVVERLIENYFPDIYEGDYVYEPVYSFKIFPTWRAVEFMLDNLFRPRNPQPKTQKEADYREEQRFEKEKQATRDVLDGVGGTVIETTLHDGSATSFANTKGIDYRPSMQGEKSE